eukprot:PhM_4_TR13977/c2_g1_i1/m.15607
MGCTSSRVVPDDATEPSSANGSKRSECFDAQIKQQPTKTRTTLGARASWYVADDGTRRHRAGSRAQPVVVYSASSTASTADSSSCPSSPSGVWRQAPVGLELPGQLPDPPEVYVTVDDGLSEWGFPATPQTTLTATESNVSFGPDARTPLLTRATVAGQCNNKNSGNDDDGDDGPILVFLLQNAV